MAITLRDLRAAVQNYLDTHVTVAISALTPAAGSSIQPGEIFTFSVTGTNSGAPDAIRLVNVRYYLTVLNPAVGKFVGPAANPDSNGITYKKPGIILGTLVNLAPNEEVGAMYLFPPASSTGVILIDRAGDLGVGDSDTISGLKGKAADPAAGGGNTQITCRIIADPDLDFLFPKNEDCPTTSRVLQVIW